MQKYLKEHTAVRLTLMALSFIMGIVLLIAGWKMTGQINGLMLMLAGVALFLVCLWIYNKQFQN